MNLSTKILIGLALGIIAGLELGAEGAGFAKTWIGPLGTIFMNMIKMVIVPLVFSSLVIGVTSLGDIKKVGRSVLSGNHCFCYCYRFGNRYYHATGRWSAYGC